MSGILNFQTGYTLSRCILAYGQPYIPGSHLNHNLTRLVQELLLTCDILNTMYIGWQIQKGWNTENKKDRTQFYVDLAVNTALLATVGAVFVIAMNWYLVPINSLPELLKSANTAEKRTKAIADLSIDHITMVWTKPMLENLTTGLFFMCTFMDLQLAYLTSQRRHFFYAIIHAMTTWKTAQYRTLAIHHSFGQLSNYFKNMKSVKKSQGHLQEDPFNTTIKKVEAIFYLNVEGLSLADLSNKIQAIYNYSSNMFSNSKWERHWHGFTGYFDRLFPSRDQGMDAYKNMWGRLKLIYTVNLQVKSPPPAPLALRIFHEDTIWMPFRGVEVFQWIPQFWIPGQKTLYATWIDADLILPLTRLDAFIIRVQQQFFSDYVSGK